MTAFLEIVEMVLPVLVMIGLGFLCNKRRLFDEKGLAGLKALIGDITLPVVLFNAFLSAQYNLRLVLVFVVMYVVSGAALAAGFALRPLAKPYGRLMPFLMACFEAGMLGYALYTLLVGAQGLSTFAMVDIGQTMFAYTIYLAALGAADGQQMTPKTILRNMLTKKPFLGMLLGMLLGATGLGALVVASPVGSIFTSLISFITAPTAGVILIIVGYELSFKKSLLRPVAITMVLRLVVMAVLLAVASFAIFSLTPFDKNLQLALMLIFALPAPFVIPLFADVGKDGEYISTTLSMDTLLAIVLFVAIAAYSRVG